MEEEQEEEEEGTIDMRHNQMKDIIFSLMKVVTILEEGTVLLLYTGVDACRGEE